MCGFIQNKLSFFQIVFCIPNIKRIISVLNLQIFQQPFSWHFALIAFPLLGLYKSIYCHGTVWADVLWRSYLHARAQGWDYTGSQKTTRYSLHLVVRLWGILLHPLFFSVLHSNKLFQAWQADNYVGSLRVTKGIKGR